MSATVDVPEAQLTPEEEAKLSGLDYYACTMVLQEAMASDTNPPAWLCMSDEARQKYLATARELVITNLRLLGAATNEAISRMIEDVPALRGPIHRWREHERLLKFHRVQGDPTAYFVHLEK